MSDAAPTSALSSTVGRGDNSLSGVTGADWGAGGGSHAFPPTPTNSPVWRAEIALTYERRDARTVLAACLHKGPLVVQKSLYPEGEAVCQNILIHPPGGIAGGDTLQIEIDARARAHAQVTTPGAARWYRSNGAVARQRVALRVAERAAMEWLPQETIVFDGAIAELDCTVELSGDAVFIGSDIVCLGRTASGERFNHGSLKQRFALSRDGTPVFVERAMMSGGSRLLASVVGLYDAPVFGTFLAAATHVTDELLGACRAVSVANESEGEGAVTRLPGLLVARYRGVSAAAARAYFTRLWICARPVLLGRAAVPPRIWNT